MKQPTEKCRVCGKTKKTDKAIGFAMCKKRVAAGILQKDFADALGMNASYLSDLESGKRRWSQKWIGRYEKALNKFTARLAS